MDRGAWQATVHGVAGLDTTEHTHTHTHTSGLGESVGVTQFLKTCVGVGWGVQLQMWGASVISL